MIKVKVVGATGYGGVGIIELLLRHPAAEIVSLVARSDDPRPIAEFFPHLQGFCDLSVQVAGQEQDSAPPDVVFFATPDGVAMREARAYLERGIKVIDYSGDFRFHEASAHDTWYGRTPHTDPDLLPRAVYGLPELHREAIARADLVANPGCFAAGILLGLAPALKNHLVDLDTLIADGKSGVSGAGKKPNPTHHFPARNENINAYRIVGHQHLGEMEEQLSQLAGREVKLTFTPHVGPWTRGILSTLYGTLLEDLSAAEARALYAEFYAAEPFVRVRPDGECPGVLSVRGSNFCELTVNVDPRTRRLVVVSCLDNLVKGQAGNALQNMNLLFGLNETTGLEHYGTYP